jgi:predicted permease
LAVSANLVVFAIVNALWLRPPRIPNADRVVMILGQNDLLATSEGFWFSEFGLNSEVRSQPVFEAVAGQVATSGINAGDEPQVVIPQVNRDVETMGVTWQYFSVIGAPVRGRDFTAADDQPGAEPVAIMSDNLWREAYGADPGVIGTVVDSLPVTLRIVGIAPRQFHGARLGERADLWVPARLVPRVASPGMASATSQSLLAIARLRRGATLADATKAMAGVAASRSSPLAGYDVVPVTELYGGPHSRTIVLNERGPMTFAALTASLVLLGGCATLMALVLVHYERRRQELAVRLALGSSRGRLTRDLMMEQTSLAVAGTAGAILVAVWAVRGLPSLGFTSGVDFARLDLALDWRVATIAALMSFAALAASVAFPIARSTRGDLVADLASNSSKATASSLRLRRLMLAVHVAATVIVLVGATLFVRTVQHGLSDGPGFDLTRTLFVSAQVSSASLPAGDRAQVLAFRDALAASRAAKARALMDGIRGIAGVEGVSFGASPLGLDQATGAARPRSLTSAISQRDGAVAIPAVGVGYFEALGVPLLAGRSFVPADVDKTGRRGAPRSAIVTASLARALWPGRSPVDQSFADTGDLSYVVVGVVADFAQGSLRLGQPAAVFVATDSEVATRSFTLSFVVRAEGSAPSLSEPIRRALLSEFPNAVRIDIATGREVVARDLGRERLGASFFGGFGLLALCLGLAGVFGMVAYLAESRRREFGVRLALGATSQMLVRSAAGVGLTAVLAGTVVGILVAAVLARVLQAALAGIDTFDLLSYAGVATVLLASGGAAGLLAAARIRRLSPIEALREE